MRIVQSFCSYGNDLLKNNFGWLTPQHHIMAWALSCLNLKQWYDDVHFYTDSATQKVLINYLQLPYTHVHCCFDNIGYGSNLWALPKIMTYSRQTTPFIHVDGDVFIWEKFSSQLEQASLVAQNLEKGTNYYKSLMNEVKQQLIALPELLERELEKDSISSVNAGILGGSDLRFIQHYTTVAFDFIKSNNKVANNLSVTTSILFEQILFHVLANAQNKEITYYFDEIINDNGYSSKTFSDFASVPFERSYLHLIGVKKKGKVACKFIESILLKQYPAYYARIIHLFKSTHSFYNIRKDILKEEDSGGMKCLENSDDKTISSYRRSLNAIKTEISDIDITAVENIESFVAASDCDRIKKIFEYEKELSLMVSAWKNIEPAHLYALELSATTWFGFFYDDISMQENYVLKINPYLTAIEQSFEWEEEMFKLIMDNPEKKFNDEVIGVVCVPELFFNGYREVLIDTLAYNVLIFIEHPISVKELVKKIQECFASEDSVDYNMVFGFVLMKLKFLFANKCIFIDENS